MSSENIEKILKKLDLNDKEIATYLALLSLGQSSIRHVAQKTRINRGTVYEALKSLQEKGLVSYFHKEKHQHFVAEDPSILKNILSQKQESLKDTEIEIENIIPTLENLKHQTKDKPLVKFYENYSGIKVILQDVLDSVHGAEKKEYAVFSSSQIRPYLYNKKAFPKFNDKRIKKNIHVKTIAHGAGGSVYGKDERKWLSTKESSPTYTLIYAGKVAMISVNKKDFPHGIIIEDKEIYSTQLSIFNALWKYLK